MIDYTPKPILTPTHESTLPIEAVRRRFCGVVAATGDEDWYWLLRKFLNSGSLTQSQALLMG